MMDEILKEHKPGDKPRFFLHDEMKAWLADHLKVETAVVKKESTDLELQEKLNLHKGLSTGHVAHIRVSLDGKIISKQNIDLDYTDHYQAIKTLANVVESCMVHINRLTSEVHVLQSMVHQQTKS
jgi:hypothetical protein